MMLGIVTALALSATTLSSGASDAADASLYVQSQLLPDMLAMCASSDPTASASLRVTATRWKTANEAAIEKGKRTAPEMERAYGRKFDAILEGFVARQATWLRSMSADERANQCAMLGTYLERQTR